MWIWRCGAYPTTTSDSRGSTIWSLPSSSFPPGSQPYSVDHDIVTTHEYDSYGNCIRTTQYMSDPGTPNKVVETIYDSTYHAYPRAPLLQ